MDEPQVRSSVLLTAEEAAFVWRLINAVPAIPGNMVKVAAAVVARVEAAATPADGQADVVIAPHVRKRRQPRVKVEAVVNGSEAAGAPV
jgi:hypothetical protein